MNEKFEELYSYLSSEGLTTLDKNTFYSKYSDPEKSKSIYDYLSSEGMTDLDHNAFHASYFKTPELSPSVQRAADAAKEYKESLKKKDATESPSGDGSLVSGKSKWASVIEEDKPAKVSGGIQEHRELVEESGGVVPEKPLFKGAMETGLSIGGVEIEGKPLIAEADLEAISDGKADDFVKKHAPKLTGEDKVIDLIVSQVDEALIGKNEEYVSTFLQKFFNEAPDKYKMFTFEESGTGDFMTVKNPLTNDEITISLDNWTSERDNEEARILRGYLSLNMKFPEYSTTTYNWNKATKELEDMDPTDWQAYTEKSNEVKRLSAEREAILAKMRSTASTNKYASYAISKMRGINSLDFDTSDLTVGKLRLEEKKKEAQEFNDKVSSGEIDLSIPENVEFVNNRNDQYNKEIQKDTDILINKQANLKNQAADIEEIAGGAIAVAENRGNFLSGIARSASRGASQPLEYIARMGGFEQADAGEIASQLFYDPTTIDDEYLASEDRNLFEKGVFGVVESVAAAASGSVLTGGMGGVTILGAKIGVGSMFGMYSMSYNGMIDEMNSPEFKDVPESQKRLFSSIYGWTVGLLEEFGISKIFSKSPVGKNAIKYIMQKTGRELPKDASNEVLERAIRSNINYAIANGIINVGGASVVEGAVEASQTIAEIGLKEAFEWTTGREGQFDTDALWAGLPESFKVGLVGGATFNGITQLTQLPSDIYNAQSIKAMDKIVSDPELFPMYKQYVKSRILNGEITKEEAKKSIDVLGQVSAKLNKIPDNISDDAKYEAYLLLDEKEKLQKEIKEKDKALSSAQQNRINQIDEQLKTISENAVQKQSTTEVPDVEAAGVSEEVAEGKPAAEPQVVTEEGKEEVTYGTYPSGKDGEFTLIGDSTNTVYRVNDITGRVQYKDKGSGLWSNVGKGTSETMILGTAKKRGFSVVATPSEEVAEGKPAAEPEVVTEEGKKEVSKPTSNQITVDNGLEFIQQADEKHVKTVKAAGRVVKALEKLGVKVFVHKTTDEYNQGISNATGISKKDIDAETTKSRGEFIPGKNEIHINLESANARTVFHEAFHAVVKAKGFSPMDMKRFVDAVKKSGNLPKEVIKKLDDFSNQYEAGEVNEEFLSELIGDLAASAETMNQTQLQRLVDAINTLFQKLRLGTPFKGRANRKEVIDFLNGVSQSLSQGREIDSSNTINKVDNKDSIENTYVETNGNVGSTESNRKAQIVNTVVSQDDVIDPATLEGKPLEVVYYDNFTSSNYSLTNRVSGTSIDRKGEGGPGYSYRPEIKEAGVIAAFTNVTKGLNLIQGISSRNNVAGENAVVGVALQNKETGHLGNKTTLRDFYDPKDGEIARAVSDGIISEKKAVDMLKQAVKAYESTKKGQSEVSSLGFTSSDFNSIQEFYDLMDGISFERRGTFNQIIIPTKSDLKITKSTKPHAKTWLKSGIPTLSDYYSSTTEAYTSEAQSHDIVKYLDPNLNKIGVSSNVEVSDAELSRARSMGVEIVKIDDGIAHTSYPVVLFGENIGVPSVFHSVRDMASDWDVPNPFFKAGRRKDTAEPVRIPKVDKKDAAPKVQPSRKKQISDRERQVAGAAIEQTDKLRKLIPENIQQKSQILTGRRDQEYVEYRGEKIPIDEYKANRTDLEVVSIYLFQDRYNKLNEDQRTQVDVWADEFLSGTVNDSVKDDISVIYRLPDGNFIQDFFKGDLFEAAEEARRRRMITIPTSRKKQISNVLSDKGLSSKSIKTIEDNYESAFGFYSFDWNKESERNNFREWFNDFVLAEFDKNLEKHIRLVSDDIKILKDREVADEKLKAFEELIIPALGSDIIPPKLTVAQAKALWYSHSIEELNNNMKEATEILDPEGNLKRESITESKLFKDDQVNLPAFERFVKTHPEYETVFFDWKKLFDESIRLTLAKTNASRYPSIATLESLHDDLSSLKQPSRKKQISGDGKNKAMDDAKAKYELSKKRGNSEAQARESAIADLKKNDWYVQASDIEKDAAVRELKEELGFKKEKKAPSAAKILGKPKRKKVEVDEVAALKDQIRLEAKSAREGAKSEKDVRKKIARTLKDMMEKAPRIFKEKQVTAIVQRALGLNLSNPVMEQRFIEYVDKVYNDAEYAAKEQEALKLQREIKNKTKKKGTKQNTNYTVGKAFGRINPSLVEDIDEYIAAANEVINALGKSRLFGADVIFRNMPNLGDISTYIETEIARQEEIEKNTLLELFPELVEAGVINDKQSLSQIREILKAIQQKDDVGLTDEQKQNIIDTVSERFALVQDITRQMVESGIDPFTGEEVTLSSVELAALKNMLEIDLGDLSIKQALELVDVMTNFITNGVTDNIDSITAVIEGNKNAKVADAMLNPEYKDKNWKVTRAYDAMFATLPLFLEKLTGSPTLAGKFADLMGINEYREGFVRATKEVTRAKDEYSSKFEKTKPNGLHFRSAENVYERGMYAFLTRNVSGTKEEQITEFNRRVNLIKETIAFLTSNSKRVTDDMRRKGEMYQKVAESMGLFDDNLTILDIESRVDKTNKAAVNFWIDKWMDSYSDVSDIAKTVYNKELGQDQNYIPDTYRKVDKVGEFDPDNMEFARFDDVVGQEAGSLKDIVRPEKLPKTSTGAIDRYVDLTFDMNNASAYEAALTDVYTARAARKIKGFLNSKEFSEMFTAENKDILKSKIVQFAQASRGKDRQRELEEQTIRKIANSVSKIAVSLGLGGVTQIVRQTVPVMVATAMQTRRGSTGVYDYFKNRDAVNEWLSSNNADVAIRGLESSTVAKMSDKQRLKIQKKLESLQDKPGKLVEFYLKTFLQSGDVGVAKASFIAHYKTALERLGKSTDIDFTKPMDPDAKAYAQQMLDRHQNVSLGGLQGQAFTDSRIWADVGRKVMLPFANFVINAKVRTAADVRTLTSKGVKTEDRLNAARSIGGTVAEIAVYRAMAAGINGVIQSGMYALAGYDPEDDDPEINKEVEKENNRRIKAGLEPMTDTEEKEFRQNILSDRWWENFYKTSVTQAVTDLFSPMPPFDEYVLKGSNALIKPITEPSEDSIDQAVLEENERRADLRMKAMTNEEKAKFIDDYKDKQTFQLWENSFGEGGYGMYNIPTEKSSEAFKYAFAATTGVIESESQMGKSKRYLSDNDREIAKIGTFAKLLYISRLAPTEVGYAADKLMKAVEKSSMTPAQNTEYRDIIALLKNAGVSDLTQKEENMIKMGSSGFEAIVESRMKDSVDMDLIKRMVVVNEISDASGLTRAEVIDRIGSQDVNKYTMNLFESEIASFNERSAVFEAAKKKYETSKIEELKKVVR